MPGQPLPSNLKDIPGPPPPPSHPPVSSAPPQSDLEAKSSSPHVGNPTVIPGPPQLKSATPTPGVPSFAGSQATPSQPSVGSSTSISSSSDTSTPIPGPPPMTSKLGSSLGADSTIAQDPTPGAQMMESVARTAPHAEPTSKQPNRPLTAAEQYERLKHWLPLTKEPDTPRPAPEELRVGTRLRVEWSGAWWAAKVKDENENQVKIGFDSWSNQYDEWLSRDSNRFRLPAADDVEPPSESHTFGQPRLPTPGQDYPSERPLLSKINRPFVLKPYNPEKEFQKRQLRLKEKIAAMQRSKLGAVDPSLSSQLGALHEAPSQASKAGSTDTPSIAAAPPPEAPPPPHLETVATSHDEAFGVATSSSTAAPIGANAASDAAAVGQVAASASASQDETVMSKGSTIAQTSPETHAPKSDPSATEQHMKGRTSMAPMPVHADQKSDDTAVASSSGASRVDAVMWEEVLSDKQERYYHELATGRTQWELPTRGWIELIAPDGARYYWNPERNVTQWVRP